MPSIRSQVNSVPVVLQADITNSTTTLLDTALSFPALPNSTYLVEGLLRYDAAAGTTGALFNVRGANITSVSGLIANNDTTTTVRNFATNVTTAPSAATAGGYTNGNTCKIELLVTTTTNSATPTVSFASEVASSAITLKSGSFIRYTKIA